MSLRKKLAWIGVLYLTQGFPFVLIVSQLPVYFRQHGVSLSDIGFLSLLTLPWSLKIAWAPIVDRYGERKVWIAAMQLALAVCCLLIPSFDPAQPTVGLWSLLALMSFASATADIAIDTYTVEILSKEEMAIGNASRMYGWKVGSIVAASGLGMLATRFSWAQAFQGAAGFLLMLMPVTLMAPSPRAFMLERDIKEIRSPFSREFWLEGYSALMTRKGIIPILLFILTYKLGSGTIATVIRPFWVDRGYSAEEIGHVTGTIGTIESFIAPAVAAWLILRLKIFHALWLFGLLQIAPALLYAAVAHWNLGRPFLYAASLSESFDISLAAMALTTFLMMVCEKKHAATQYAFLSSVFGFTRSIAGWIGPQLAARWDYAPFFAFTFFLGFVAFFFLPAVRRWTRPKPT